MTRVARKLTPIPSSHERSAHVFRKSKKVARKKSQAIALDKHTWTARDFYLWARKDLEAVLGASPVLHCCGNLDNRRGPGLCGTTRSPGARGSTASVDASGKPGVCSSSGCREMLTKKRD